MVLKKYVARITAHAIVIEFGTGMPVTEAAVTR